jgi:nickel/cobalt transporter (NicO) family protein
MGLAGGLVPSPSALLVLLAAVALDRLWFGLVLVVAYGIGLAMTLIGAGLLMSRVEVQLRGFFAARPSGLTTTAIGVLPIMSALALVGGGALVALRAFSGL